MNQHQNQFQVLPDELVSEVGEWVVDHVKDVVSLHATCRRLRLILLEPAFLREIALLLGVSVQEQAAMHTLEQLGFFQAIQKAGLLQENRIGFDYASLEVEDLTEDRQEDNFTRNNLERIQSVRTVWKQFETSTLIVNAHCGTLAPRGVASRFSRVRGAEVLEAILQNDDPAQDDQARMAVYAWGKRLANQAATSTHRYGPWARQGRGWVEVSLILNEMELPPLPNYYDGINVSAFVPIPSARRIREEMR